MFPIILILAIFALLPCADAFGSKASALRACRRAHVSMEYIPDGMSKAQWDSIKKKEAEANKGKDLGAVGITKFKSRSFESWQKGGQKHLFPVDPKVRPHLQCM